MFSTTWSTESAAAQVHSLAPVAPPCLTIKCNPFADVGSSKGVADTGDSVGVAFGDIDGDGDLDLFVVNQGQANKLYANAFGVTSTTLVVKPLTGDGAPSIFGSVSLMDGDGNLVAVRILDGGSGFFSQSG